MDKKINKWFNNNNNNDKNDNNSNIQINNQCNK